MVRLRSISPLDANGSDGPGKDFNGVSGSGPAMVLVLLVAPRTRAPRWSELDVNSA
jgi:hypothetical protein